MLKRIIGVFLLRPDVFRSIGTDQAATFQASVIVTVVGLISAVSAAISAVLWGVGFTVANAGLSMLDNTIADIGFRLPTLDGPVAAFAGTLVGAYVSWLLWALVTWLIGEYAFHGDTSFAEMVRIIGYAKAPQALSGLGFIPGIGWLPRLIGWVWMALATYTGVRTGLDVSRGKAALTIACSAIAVLLVNWLVVNPVNAGLV